MPSILEHEKNLFIAALDIESPAERAAFLNRECAGNSALRGRVEKLLAVHERAESFFTDCKPALRPADRRKCQTELEALALETFDKTGAEIGTLIGPYKLLQKIGEGGCGVVYMADQQSPVRRRVALKIIKAGMDTRSVIARFEAERQALAMMDHPNIARVLDAGETETGRPFFVMELVNGIRITQYCDDRKLEMRERLNLFFRVCHAIQHAHQKGIIHRDIKPTNILVTHHDGVPVPKVIDFGIAKATQEPLTDKTLFTMFGHFVGTPAYMSPEQAEMSGLDVDTRSDIYSLGVLLYELLTGKTPFDQKELLASGIDEMRKTLREREPHRPSTKLDTMTITELTATAMHRHIEPPKLQSVLSGDLDWIVMKALEKDRRRRYETANGLAMDVQRFLNSEPIIARPPSRIYRFQKLVRRNRGVFAAVGAVSMSLVIGLGISTLLFIRERDARRIAVVAERQAERARQNEANLRRESESRERVTQARLFVSNGKMEDADRLAEKFPLDKPALESAAVLRSLGEWHAQANRWPVAADRFEQLLRVNRSDSWNVATSDALGCAAAIGQTGDAERFAHFREALIGRFSNEQNPIIVERILRAGLLLHLDARAMKLLQPFAEMVAPKTPVSIGDSHPARMPAEGGENVLQKLALKNIGTHQPFLMQRDGGVVTIVAGGADIWKRQDEFAYACTLVTGDFDFRMQVLSVTPMLDIFTRVGLMARESADSPGSRHVMVAVNAENSFQVVMRSAEGASSDSLPHDPLPRAYGSNSWVRLERVGAIFHAYTSSNGVDWAQLYQTTGGDRPFSDPIYFGLAATAHATNAMATNVVCHFGPTPTVTANVAVTLGLLEYRRGNFAKAAEWCRRSLAYPEFDAVRIATARVILAMASARLGQNEDARVELAQARSLIPDKFTAGLETSGGANDFWFDSAFAKILLREAEAQASARFQPPSD